MSTRPRDELNPANRRVTQPEPFIVERDRWGPPDVHWRLYDHPGEGPTVVCVQDFDYPDYETARWIGVEAWWSEDAALAELRRMQGYTR